MKHQATATFWKLYRKLKPEIQALADKNFALLKKDPKHPSLRFKCIRDDLMVRPDRPALQGLGN